MSLIQIALVLGSILLLLLYSAFLRSTLRDRVLTILLFVIAVVAILFPDLTTRVANVLGVGRGTDLLIYLFVLAAVFAFIRPERADHAPRRQHHRTSSGTRPFPGRQAG